MAHPGARNLGVTRGLTAVSVGMVALLKAATPSAAADRIHDVMPERCQATIEHATGRRVIGFMTGNQSAPDRIYELFLLCGCGRRAGGRPRGFDTPRPAGDGTGPVYRHDRTSTSIGLVPGTRAAAGAS
jgi:hypothetical protein